MRKKNHSGSGIPYDHASVKRMKTGYGLSRKERRIVREEGISFLFQRNFLFDY